MTDKVCLGFHSFGTCTTQFAVSLAGMIRYEGTKISSVIHVPSPYVTEARNKLVKRFLTKTTASHLLMLDVDLEFPEDSLGLTLSALQTEPGAEIMFGTYALGDFRPSIFAFPGEGGHLPTVAQDLENGKTYQIYAGSTGWLLMTRKAAEIVGEANKDKNWPWFDHDQESCDQLTGQELGIEGSDRIRIGEDFTFSKRAREAGLKLYGTTKPLLIHGKMQPLLNDFQQSEALRRGLKVSNLGEDKPKEETDAKSIRENARLLYPKGNVVEGSKDEGSTDIQLPPPGTASN